MSGALPHDSSVWVKYYNPGKPSWSTVMKTKLMKRLAFTTGNIEDLEVARLTMMMMKTSPCLKLKGGLVVLFLEKNGTRIGPALPNSLMMARSRLT